MRCKVKSEGGRGRGSGLRDQLKAGTEKGRPKPRTSQRDVRHRLECGRSLRSSCRESGVSPPSLWLPPPQKGATSRRDLRFASRVGYRWLELKRERPKPRTSQRDV